MRLARGESIYVDLQLTSGRITMVMTAYNLFPLEAERAIDQHFEVSETLASPDGLTFRVFRYRS